MGRKSKLTWQERLAAVTAYLNGEGSYKSIAAEYGIGKSALIRYVAHYRAYGADGIRPLATNTHYSPELKRQAVEAYLHSESSLNEICVKFNISGDSVLLNWIKQYNGHNDSRSHSSHRSEINMTKARTTTLEERIEIVAYCLEHGKDYSATITKYGISYQQIYSWVRKYEAKGVDGLVDRRGKAKPESELTEVDRLKARIRILEAENRRMQLEADIRKKLKEIERRRD